MNKPSVPLFKCENSLWQMLADGSKTFDMRRNDLTDDRLRGLRWSHTLSKDEHSGEVYDIYVRPADEEQQKHLAEEVSFLNKATGEVLTFKYKGIRFADWAPGWCFLLLGEKVP